MGLDEETLETGVWDALIAVVGMHLQFVVEIPRGTAASF